MMQLPPVTYPETPKGKRRVVSNIWGNVVGYVGRQRFWEFGVRNSWNLAVAENWRNGDTLEAARRGLSEINSKDIV